MTVAMTSENNVICMDLLNYSDRFFNFRKDNSEEILDYMEEVVNARKKVSSFVDAVTNTGFQLICFIDRSRMTEVKT